MKSPISLSFLIATFLISFASSSQPIESCAKSFDVETKLSANDGAYADGLGGSVAISGSIVIAGAASADGDGGSNSGAAYLFDVTTGNQLIKLTADDASKSDLFGSSVAVSDSTAIVGASRNDNSGSAYLFDVATGNQLFKLKANDASEGERFGRSVAISGNTALVGSHHNRDASANFGSAYLFDTTTGKQITKLVADDPSHGDGFGFSVAISGDVAIVGAHRSDEVGINSGSAYLFDVTTGNQLFKLTADDAADRDSFGGSVAISGNTAIVGAAYTDDGGWASGSAYLFDVTTGKQLIKLTAEDPIPQEFFGWSVAIHDGMAMVGTADYDNLKDFKGAAYLFDVTTGDQIKKLTGHNVAREEAFGFSVAIGDHTAVVGSPGGDFTGSYSGLAYVYTPEPSSFSLAVLASLYSFATTRRRK